MGKAAVIMWCRKKFFKYWRVLVPALLLAALCRPGPGPAAEAGGGGSVTVPEEPPLVALTFDDGPRTSTTSRLLDGLALREIQATFFLVGDRIQGQEALVRRMAEDGHQIGVHSYDHSCISDLSRADFDLQVGRTRGVLSAVLGSGDFWLRPPYGIIDLGIAGDQPVLASVFHNPVEHLPHLFRVFSALLQIHFRTFPQFAEKSHNRFLLNDSM